MYIYIYNLYTHTHTHTYIYIDKYIHAYIHNTHTIGDIIILIM